MKTKLFGKVKVGQKFTIYGLTYVKISETEAYSANQPKDYQIISLDYFTIVLV